MFEQTMHDGLGLDNKDSLVGFIYLGTPKAVKSLPKLDSATFTEYWTG